MNNQEILEQLEQLQLQIEELRNHVLSKGKESLRRKKTKNLSIYEYHSFFTWHQKIIFILTYYGRPLLSSEIVSFLDNYDTVFQNKQTELDKLKMLSTHLNRAIVKKNIIRFKKPGVRGYYYSIEEKLLLTIKQAQRIGMPTFITRNF